MYQDHTPLQAAGQLLLGAAFLASGLRNAFWTFAQHEKRMAALRVPWPRAALIGGLALLFAGALMLLADYERQVGAALLLVFTALASAIFHRWWLIGDPLLRHLHIGNLMVNAGVAGGLLLVAAI